MIEIDFTNFDKKMRQSIEKIGEVVETEMIDRCPKESGMMAASIDVDTITEFSSKTGGEIGVGTHDIDYAPYVEWGTPNAKYPIVVGTPESPRTEWNALKKRGATGLGQTMPFASSANFFTEDERLNVLKEAFK